MEVLQNDRPSKLPPSLPSSSSSVRKSVIKISSNGRFDSEQMEKCSIKQNNSSANTTENAPRTRIIPIFRSISNSGANPVATNPECDPFATSDIRLPSYNFNYKSPFNRINFTISSPDPFSRPHSRISALHSQKSPITDRCQSSMSSGYDSLSSISSNHMPTSPEIRFREIRRTSSANRLYSGKQPSQQQAAPNSPFNYETVDESNNNIRSTRQTKRFSLNENCIKEDVQKALDQVEKRIVFFREIAFELFEEKNKLIEALNKVNSSCSSNTFTEVDLQDIGATTEHLMNRLNSVDIVIKPVRSSTQVEAFERANKCVDALNRTLAKEGKLGAKKQCLCYINSCSSDDLADSTNPDLLGPIDERFQKMVIECSLDDQKIIKKKLKTFLEQIDKKQ